MVEGTGTFPRFINCSDLISQNSLINCDKRDAIKQPLSQISLSSIQKCSPVTLNTLTAYI